MSYRDSLPSFEPDDPSGVRDLDFEVAPFVPPTESESAILAEREAFDEHYVPLDYPADLPYPPERAVEWPATSRYRHRPTAIPADSRGELESFREIARSLAAGSDSSAVLRVLCAAAMEVGRSSGAIVGEVTADGGSFVAAAGSVSDLIGRSFPLEGSVTARVVARRSSIAIKTMSESSPFFESLLGERGVGPALVVPLLAHESFLGVLIVTRRVDTPVFDDDDELRLLTVADLAALALWKARQLEASRAADQAKTAFLATLSHELRTPMTALEGYSELLEDEILGPLAPAQREVLTNLRAVGRHLGAMIEEMLTFASLEADRVLLHCAPVNIDELLDSLHPVLAPLAREKGIMLRMTADDGLPAVHSDADRLRQILLNLSANAIKFTAEGEVTVHVSMAPAEGNGAAMLAFRVEDTGVGIPEGDHHKLFQAFTQLDNGPTRRHGGTGLGLYISRRLAELLGGRITLASTPGVGSVFTLALPA